MDLTRILLVGAGGFLGSIARYVTVKTIDVRFNQTFPYGTFTVNVLGCFLIGLVMGLTGRQSANGENLRALLGAGFCGGFTTFSAFAFENHNLLAERLAFTASVYVAGSLVVGILGVFAGLWCARFL